MKVFSVLSFCITWLTVCVSPASSQSPAASDADVPVAPLPWVEFQGWTNAIRLANTNLEVMIAPDVGRIVVIRYRESENFLRFSFSPEQTGSAVWINGGGEWLWPMAQTRWSAVSGTEWPPPPELADQPWSATAWKAADRSLNCSLTREYGGPLFIKVTRNFRLHPEQPEITIRQRIERKQNTPFPFALWNIFQIAEAEAVFIPTDDDSQFQGGFTSMMFDPPQNESLELCADVIVYRAGMGEHKLCSDSKKSWIAALKKGVILFVQVFNDDTLSSYPDGGCRVEMYSNSGLGYTEIETLSPETTFQGISALQNTLIVRCFPAPATELCHIAGSLSGKDRQPRSEENTSSATPTNLISSVSHVTKQKEILPVDGTAAVEETSSSVEESPPENLNLPSVPALAPSQE